MPEAKSLRKHVVEPIGLCNEIERSVGSDAFAKLADHFGGTRIYVPVKIAADHHLWELLGSEAATRLSYDFGGLRIDIPRALTAQIERRNDSILTDRANGMTVRQLAFKYRLTARTISKTINRPNPRRRNS